jgi:alpha-amylase
MASSFYNEGITCVWLPPAYKGQGGIHDVGYGVYDMYDLGEFDQKGTGRTKYGTKEEYLSCVKALQKIRLGVIADIVFNHRMGADEKETVMAVEDNPSNRNRILRTGRD